MTVFSGVVLVLLFVFMTITPVCTLHSRPIELTNTSHAIPMPGADREDALIVAIQRDGKIFFDTTQVGREDLAVRIRDRVGRGAPGTVYVKADARARYRNVAEVVDSVRATGMTSVVFLTERRRVPTIAQ
jgi:biopolymer transport protein TolR